MSDDDRSVLLMVEDDESHAAFALRTLASTKHLHVHAVATLGEAQAFLRAHEVDLVLSDLKLPDGSGLELLDSGVPMVVQTSQGDEGRAVEAMKRGALDYCVKSPEMLRELPRIVERALSASRNLRERRRAEHSLRETDERFRQLVENIPEVFWLYDKASSRIIYASPAWSAVYGSCEKSVEGRLASVHPEDVGALRAQRTDTPASAAFRVIKHNRVSWVEERMFPIYDADGQPYRIACLGADITKRRELETAARQAQKMQAVGQLAGGIAHDFNNMLAAITSAADELSTVVATAHGSELCALILQASERAADLTRNLLSFSRLGKVVNARIDVHRVVREMVALLHRSIDRRITLIVDLAAPVCTVHGDAAQLQSALLNLGINARDAMPTGGELRVSTQLLTLDAEACQSLAFDVTPGPYLQISLCDSGKGISPEVMPHIFDPFFTTKEPGVGTGMGLAAVYGTIIEHGGAMTVQSQVDLGSEFRLYLPVVDEACAPGPVVQVAPSGQGLVLLVDDEPLVLSAVSKMLRSIGYEVITAGDGQEALKQFQAHKSRLVAVVCDAVMPRGSGLDVLRQIHDAAPTLACILCSGFSRDPGLLPSHATWELLPKPFRRVDLAQTMARAIAERAAAHTGAST
jgi:two-component system, cell cycle sensor histidine kinase and response regulator CckA